MIRPASRIQLRLQFTGQQCLRAHCQCFGVWGEFVSFGAGFITTEAKHRDFQSFHLCLKDDDTWFKDCN